jgi:uncharacterized membrane protein YebE (DUF533 family)
MLDKVLNAAIRGGLRNILGGAGRTSGRASSGGLGGALGGALGGGLGGGRGGALGGVVGQTAITAALGMLMRRGGAGRLMKVGGLASLGMMAYQAWQQYQQRAAPQGGQGAAGGANRASLLSAEAFAPAGGDDEPDEAEAQALLAAMIEAAKADGHVDDDERARIEQAMQSADGDANGPAVAAWLAGELKRPADAGAIARLAGGNEALGSKLYLASVIVAGGEGSGTVTSDERQYLDALARALGLPPALQASLDAQAKQLA